MPLRIVTRKDSKYLWIIGTVRGQRIRESTGTTDPIIAEEARAVREQEAYRAAMHGHGPARVTFAAAMLSYIEITQPAPAEAKRLDKILRHFGHRIFCNEIGQPEIDAAAKVLCSSGSTPATKLRNAIGPIRAVLRHAARRKWCDAPEFEIKLGSRARTEWLTPEQFEAIIQHAAPHLKQLIGFMVMTGARVGEAIGLAWDDVNLKHRRAVLRNTKNGNDRSVELCPRLVAMLAGLAHREGSVFRRDDGAPYTDRAGECGGEIRSGWAGALARAGMPGEYREYKRVDRPGRVSKIFAPRHTPHSCRHTWATWHYAMHRDLLMLKRDGDWHSVTLVERYAHLAPADMVGEIRAVRGEIPGPALAVSIPELTRGKSNVG